MSLENAQDFVNRMREDEIFRQTARKAAADQALANFLQDQGNHFDLHHLVMAMAGCMDELARAIEPTE